MIIAGADNRPPMLAKSMYDSWKSRIELYIENRENGRMILNSVQHGPLGLPPDVYVIVNHHKVAKEIWDRVKLLMQGTQLSLQEKECKLYDEFDKFSFVKGETLLAVPVFTLGDDPIARLNKAMAFISGVAALRFTSTNNQLRTSSNMRNRATILDGRIIVQQVQGRQGQSYAGIGNMGEGHMARQCIQPKRPRNSAWFHEKMLLVQAQESCHDLDAYDFDCDNVSTAKAVRMANLSKYGSDVLLEEKLALKQQIDLLSQNLSNQTKENESLLQTFNGFKNISKETTNKYMEKEIDLEKKIKELKNIYKLGQFAQTVHMLTKPQVFYDDTHKQALGYQNPFYLNKAQRIRPTLYDGSVISSQHTVFPVIDEEETLILEEVSRSKMLAKQNDPISKEKKINTTPINYVKLNQLSQDFGKHFVPQQELSTEQAFWLQTSNPNTEQYDISPVRIEASGELPKVSLVNTSLKKLKIHLYKSYTVVKKPDYT
ncbi:hypothetical protein Tco_0581377 [Tanacetum coccineum]